MIQKKINSNEMLFEVAKIHFQNRVNVWRWAPFPFSFQQQANVINRTKVAVRKTLLLSENDFADFTDMKFLVLSGK